jgi:putative Ca2+/H+ antiporter (TMEM165/GDT1 family)
MPILLTIFFATYGAVFIAEIVGDKLLYTTGVLATRYRAASIICGMGAAFMVKMAVAVAVGDAIARLPRWIVATVTAASFIGVALTLWRKPDMRKPKEKDSRILQGAMVAFAAIFFSEWGDVGMVMAGTMSAKFVWSVRAVAPTFHETTVAAVVVWLGAVSAMVTKGGLAVTLGAGVRAWIAERVSPRMVRYIAVAALIVLGTLSVLETLGILTD